MTLPENYTADSKIKSLSSSLGTIAMDSHSTSLYLNPTIKSENLKYNLTGLLSKIILKLKLKNGKVADFIQIIEQYNSKNGTQIHYENFSNINWITEADLEIVIPERLRIFLFRKEYALQEGKTVKIPNEVQHLISILELYYVQFYKNRRLLITSKELYAILKNGHTTLNIHFLLEKGIVEKTENAKIYKWIDAKEYGRHLGTEIAATLWDEFGGESAEYESFRQYYRLIRAAAIRPADLKNYLTPKSCNNLINLSVKFIYAQQDLKKSDAEFRKIWLNAYDHYDRDIAFQIPLVEFEYVDTYRFINSVKKAEHLYPDIFDLQSSRSQFLLLLNIIVQNESEYPRPHENALKLLKDLDLPIVTWNLYNCIPNNYPLLIPFLVTDLDLAPLAFRLIDKIKISDSFDSEDAGGQKYSLNRGELDSYWIEMFNVFLEKSEPISSEKAKMGTVLARILGDLALKVFSSGGHTSNNRTDHLVYRKRYETVIKKLGSLRLSNSFSYGSMVNPRIIFSYLPAMAKYVIGEISSFQFPENGYLRINSSWTDLGIEILKMLNLRSSEAEISKAQISELQETSRFLASALRDYLFHYYTIEKFDIINLDGHKTTKGTASRTDREFGFEIIDWGYLALCLEKESFLDNLDSGIMGSLNFFNEGDKYDDQNMAQAIKLKLYIKSLLLAYLAINEKKIEYDISGLPVISVLNKLEKLIASYALCYSVEDISNNRTDIFNELYSSFGYYPYHNHLADLLYRCIAYFKIDSQEKFVTDYVHQNNDISRLLAALNVIDQKNLQDIISERISNIDVADYISSKYMITDLEYALREAIVSENHWELAEEFLLKIQSHYNRFKGKYTNSEDFLFEINLMLAFRQKNQDKLNGLEVPEKQYRIQGENKKGRDLKNYYIALFAIYNTKMYDSAIELLQKLLLDDPKNIRYAFQLYRAQTLKAIQS